MLRTVLVVLYGQKFEVLRFWKLMYSFVLLAYESLAASRTLSQRLLACLNFSLDSEDLSFWYKKNDFYELWQQHKQLKIMEMSETWPDTFDEVHIHHFQPESTPKFTSSSRSPEFKDILPWNISQIIMKTIPISTRIVTKNVMKRGIALWMWCKVKVNWDDNTIRVSQWRESDCRTNISVTRNK